MDVNFEDSSACELAYALELYFSYAVSERDWNEALGEAADEWIEDREQGREVGEAWRAVLAQADLDVAQILVRDFARQGHQSPEESLRLLRRWFEHLGPVWRALDSENSPEVCLPHYVKDHLV